MFFCEQDTPGIKAVTLKLLSLDNANLKSLRIKPKLKEEIMTMKYGLGT